MSMKIKIKIKMKMKMKMKMKIKISPNSRTQEVQPSEGRSPAEKQPAMFGYLKRTKNYKNIKIKNQTVKFLTHQEYPDDQLKTTNL